MNGKQHDLETIVVVMRMFGIDEPSGSVAVWIIVSIKQVVGQPYTQAGIEDRRLHSLHRPWKR